MTPSPVRKAIQESKQEKPRMDCTYCTGKSGLNLQKEETEKLTLEQKLYLTFGYRPFWNLTYVLTMARSAIFLSLSTNLSMRYEAMRGASRYNLKKR